jgi:hypothetical protein
MFTILGKLDCNRFPNWDFRAVRSGFNLSEEYVLFRLMDCFLQIHADLPFPPRRLYQGRMDYGVQYCVDPAIRVLDVKSSSRRPQSPPVRSAIGLVGSWVRLRRRG